MSKLGMPKLQKMTIVVTEKNANFEYEYKLFIVAVRLGVTNFLFCLNEQNIMGDYYFKILFVLFK
jgi:hypothetical protein